ncbi:MAG: hypothetical protein ACNA7G_12605 [Methylobacter sp.]
MTTKQSMKTALAGGIGLILSGCAGGLYVSKSPPPRSSGPSAPIVKALSCISESGALRRTKFAIAVHADGTGKTNYVSEGSTGSFLPQGTTASYVSEAVLMAGGRAQNYYELNTEMAIRKFATNAVNDSLAQMLSKSAPDYVMSTSFTALDFLGGPTLDFRYSGIGPEYAARGASLEVVAELYRPGDREIVAMSTMNREIIYQEVGFTINRYFSELLTGGFTYQDQQKLQEGTRDTVALSVADVLSRFENVPEQCKRMVYNLKNGIEDKPVRVAELGSNDDLEDRLNRLERDLQSNFQRIERALSNNQRVAYPVYYQQPVNYPAYPQQQPQGDYAQQQRQGGYPSNQPQQQYYR